MGLLDYLLKKTGNKTESYRASLFGTSGRKTPAMLLGRLPSSMKTPAGSTPLVSFHRHNAQAGYSKKGRTYLFGNRANRMDPVHAANPAKCCVGTMESKKREIEAGGPGMVAHREIAELASRALGHPVRISAIPQWLIRATFAVAKLFNEHQDELLEFFATMMTNGAVAPATEKHCLDAQFRELAAVS